MSIANRPPDVSRRHHRPADGATGVTTSPDAQRRRLRPRRRPADDDASSAGRRRRRRRGLHDRRHPGHAALHGQRRRERRPSPSRPSGSSTTRTTSISSSSATSVTSPRTSTRSRSSGSGPTRQWTSSTTAGIPNNLAPGNHDMGRRRDVRTSTTSTSRRARYDPPEQPWYGGWLGEEAGQIQRLNKDNYELFTAGGIDFLIIHLEIDMPSYAVAWANEIIDRYPDRHGDREHARLPEHLEQPPDGHDHGPQRMADRRRRSGRSSSPRTATSSWSSTGTTRARAARRRTTPAAQPVHQLLTDYQSRANGGDGWLRYYTFKPCGEQGLRVHVLAETRHVRERRDQPVLLDHQMGGSARST